MFDTKEEIQKLKINKYNNYFNTIHLPISELRLGRLNPKLQHLT